MEQGVIWGVLGLLVVYGVISLVVSNANKAKIKRLYDDNFNSLKALMEKANQEMGGEETQQQGRSIAELEKQVAELTQQLQEDRRRIEVLERIVTDPANQVKREIETLA